MRDPNPTRRRGSRQRGFTLVELMIVVAMIGVLASIGTPLLDRFFTDLRLKGAARDTADTLRLARIEAIRTGTAHLVLFSAAAAGNPAATDPAGTSLGADPASGGVFPILLVSDTNGDCRISAGEDRRPIHAQRGVAWGTTVSGGALAPGDTGAFDHSSGSSFRSPAGAGTTWVMFRPDGVPVGFDAACNPGGVGSGGGAIYLTNGRRDYAIVLSPLGGVRVHAWNVGMATWTN